MNILKRPVFRIALTHLLSKKRQTIVAMLGVTFGIAMFIFQAGLMSGFQSTFIEETVNTTANIRIYNDVQAVRQSILETFHPADDHWYLVHNQKPKDEDPKVKDGQQIMKIIENDPAVSGVSPFIGSQALFKLGLAQASGRIAGVDIAKENAIFNVEKHMKEGDILDLETSPNGIILGYGLSIKLGAKVGDNMVIVSPKGNSLDMRVVGIHKSGIVEMDNTRAYINIRNAQKLLGVDNSYITDLNIKLKDINKAEVIAKKYQDEFGFKAQDWKSANENIFGIFKIQNMITYLVISSILIVSGFGIFNILMMIIYEKMPDIAILKATGFKDRDIKKIFLLESLVIGVLGGIIGLILGYTIQKIVGSIKMDVRGFVAIDRLHFNQSPIFFIVAFCFGLAATALAGYIPARKASKIDAIDIIRAK
ncbi:MAG TPA: FtsX-like permease family protein [Bacteroidia bacterium]|jgi:lipoprotein-releasing system permease protein|nr:FtsX-like permease family protein [Bacteroidia bacterium]